MNAQGFASYSVCGVQERMVRFYSGGRPGGIRLQSRDGFESYTAR